MPRLPRVYIKDAIYFITCRGEHAENIFKDERDYRMFLELLRKYQEQYQVKVFAFCLLPDHLHLLVELQKQNENASPPATRSQQISDFMRDLNNNYTKYFNGRYERKGHLFRERFKAVLVEKEPFLLDMTAYIHLNPEKLNLTKDAKSYPYSSYQLYLFDDQTGQEDLNFLNAAVKEALDLLQNRSYSEYAQNVSAEKRALIRKKLNRGGILGSEEFVKQVREEVQNYQAQGLAKKYEMTDNKGYKLFLIYGSLFVILMASAGLVYVFFINKEQLNLKTQMQNLTTSVKQQGAVSGDWRVSEWHIKLTPIRGGNGSLDVLSFKDSTFISTKLNSLGFANSSFSQAIDEDGRIVWKTSQTSPHAVATWKGQVSGKTMKGILSLREEGKEPQDFSFVSSE
jgi:putative transposase